MYKRKCCIINDLVELPTKCIFIVCPQKKMLHWNDRKGKILLKREGHEMFKPPSRIHNNTPLIDITSVVLNERNQNINT